MGIERVLRDAKFPRRTLGVHARFMQGTDNLTLAQTEVLPTSREPPEVEKHGRLSNRRWHETGSNTDDVPIVIDCCNYYVILSALEGLAKR
jgi:hypothetical protein